MRLLCAMALLAMACAAGNLRAAEAPSTEIRKWQSLAEVRKIFSDTKAKDISDGVGILFGTDPGNEVEGLWYVTGKKTAVALKFERKEGQGEFLLVSIEAGECGKGYGGKFEWLAQKRRDLETFNPGKE